MALDEELGKKAGVLLGRSGARDVVDAALICLARDGDDIVTSEPAGLRRLAESAGVHVDLLPNRSKIGTPGPATSSFSSKPAGPGPK